jgi:hypothetical protein
MQQDAEELYSSVMTTLSNNLKEVCVTVEVIILVCLSTPVSCRISVQVPFKCVKLLVLVVAKQMAC